jgi:hypothetical protein
MTNIDPNKFYTINQIAIQKLLPWISSNQAIKRYVMYDLGHDNILQTVIKPGGISGVRYFIKGENIIKILAKFEDGSLFLNYPSRGHKNARSSQDS